MCIHSQRERHEKMGSLSWETFQIIFYKTSCHPFYTFFSLNMELKIYTKSETDMKKVWKRIFFPQKRETFKIITFHLLAMLLMHREKNYSHRKNRYIAISFVHRQSSVLISPNVLICKVFFFGERKKDSLNFH